MSVVRQSDDQLSPIIKFHRHSREGGSPALGRGACRKLDSRLSPSRSLGFAMAERCRGNDGVRGWCGSSKNAAALFFSLLAYTNVAQAETVTNPLAQFSGLDKITGLTTQFEIKINEEAKFGSLIVKPFVCNTRPITEEPKTTSFVQVQDVAADGSKKMIFSGWMFAESPGLNAVEHPTFDVWLTGCRDPIAPPPPVETAPPADPGAVPEEGGGGTVQD
jgi:hypothetical protein